MSTSTSSIPDRVGAGLLAAGVPAAKHDAGSLAGLFPAEFKKVAAICTHRADVTADELVSIVTAHQDALYQR